MKNFVFSAHRPDPRLGAPERIPGLPYLLLIALIAAAAGGAFQMDERALLLPAFFSSVLLLIGMGAKKAWSVWCRNKRSEG